MTMQNLAARYGAAVAVPSRVREASRFGLMANGVWSIGSCAALVPTTDHKHEPPRRPTVIPT